MEMDLSNVIEKIKQDGVEKAEQEAKGIRDDAQARAKKIVADAEKQKAVLIAQAQSEAAKLQANSEEAIRMAARDVIIALKTEIIKFFDLVVKKQVASSLSPDILKEIIVRLVTQCYKKSDFDIEILLNEADKENLRKLLEKDLQEEIRKGITFYPSPSVKKGFRIGEKDKNLYYDFTDDAIAETLNFYLNKKVKEIIDLGLKENNVQ